MFQLSPGVNVSEIDLATGIPAVSTTEAGMAGVFRWGPVGQRVLVTSEPDLAAKFQKPTTFNAETWFVGANFLSYGNQLHVVRVTTGTSGLALFSGTTAPNPESQVIKNKEHYESGAVTFSANVAFVAKYPGALGNSLRVAMCTTPNAYSRTLSIVSSADIATSSNVAVTVGSSTATVSVGFTGSGTITTANTQATALAAALATGDNIKVGNSSIGTQFLKVANVSSVTTNSTIATFTVNLAEPYRLHTSWASSSIERRWEFHNLVDAAPGTSDYVDAFGTAGVVDEMHLVVVDEGGGFTGVPGTVLEVHKALSRASDAKTADGTTNFAKTVINDTSNYLWWATDSSTAATANAATVATATDTTAISIRMTNGSDGDDEATIALSKVAAGYDLLAPADEVDIAFVLAGKARSADGHTHINYIIDNVSEYRKDCVTFASPPKELVINNVGNETDSLVTFANELRASSYGFLDSGYKYQYDKYNDIYRWIPLNGDIAGLAVRTDFTNDAWWSFAGYNRGRIKNAVKIAFNPNKAQRNELTKVSVNAVINEPGEGILLFDDLTLLKKASPFRSINVRRLFIILEKAIAADAKYMLFEFNDDFTRAQFRNRVVPFLRDIQGRRGIIDFEVICDASNNTGEVIDRGEFVGDIYVKPNRSIRAIQLNFVAVRSGVQFSEVIGAF